MEHYSVRFQVRRDYPRFRRPWPNEIWRIGLVPRSAARRAWTPLHHRCRPRPGQLHRPYRVSNPGGAFILQGITMKKLTRTNRTEAVTDLTLLEALGQAV